MSALTSVGLDVPYPFQVSNSPLTTDGVITLSYDPAAPLLPANGGTGLTTVGTSGQYLSTNGTVMTWVTLPPSGVSSVTATAPVVSSGGATPVISLTSTGTGVVVLNTNPVITAPTITGGMTLTGPLNGLIGVNSGPGVFAGLSPEGFASLELVSNANFKFIDMTRVGVDFDCRFIFDTTLSQLAIQIGGATPLSMTPTITTLTSSAINLVGSTNIQGTSASSIVTTNASNKISSVPLPLSPANGGTGITTIGTNGQYLTSNGTTAVWSSFIPGSTLGDTTINGFLALSGPMNSPIPGASATPGIYCGFDTGGDARIQLNSPTRYSVIDFGRPSVGVDWRIIHDDVPDTLSLQSSTGNRLVLNDTTSTLSATNIALTGSTLIQGTSASSVVTTDASNKITSIPLSGGTGAIVRDNGSTLFNTVLSGNTQYSTNFAWYTGTADFVNGSWNNYKAPTLFDSQGTLLTYNVGTGVFTNNTGGNIFVTLSFSLAKQSNAFGTAAYRVLLNGTNSLATTTVTALDYGTGTAQFKCGAASTFAVQGFQDSGSNSTYFAASNFTLNFRYYI